MRNKAFSAIALCDKQILKMKRNLWAISIFGLGILAVGFVGCGVKGSPTPYVETYPDVTPTPSPSPVAAVVPSPSPSPTPILKRKKKHN